MASNSSTNGSGSGAAANKPPTRVGSAGKLSPIPHYRIDDETQFEETYTVGRKLGEGSFGVVREVLHNTTGERWACKVVNKDNSKEKAWGSKIKLLEREVNILKRVNHEHIIKLKEVFETPQKMYLVMSLCEGGELSKELQARKTLSEEETRTITRRLASAISYLHKNDMVHRDLKLENILLSNNPCDKDDKLYVQVTDFGLSVVKGGVGHENMMMDFCGTPMYMSPEIIDNKSYSEKCDVWALGVIMCILLTGGAPFSNNQDDEKLYAQIKNLDIRQHVNTDVLWKDVSDEAKDCISMLMTLDPAHRLSSSELLDHPWITGKALDPESGPRNVLEMMKAWGNNLHEDDTPPADIPPQHPTLNSNVNNHESAKPLLRRTSQSDDYSASSSRSSSASSSRKSSGDKRRVSAPSQTGNSTPLRPSRRSASQLVTDSNSSVTAGSQKLASGSSRPPRTSGQNHTQRPPTNSRSSTDLQKTKPRTTKGSTESSKQVKKVSR